MRALIVALLLFLGSGCAGPPEEPNDGTGPTVPAARTMDAPQWRIGDWWSWRIEARDYGSLDLTTVVRGVDAKGYDVAVAPLDAGVRLSWFHAPLHGRVDRPDLAWEAHDQPVGVLSFPLFDGKRWVGEVEGSVVRYDADIHGDLAWINGTYEDGRLAIRAQYSGAAFTLTEVTFHYGSEQPWASARLVNHGALYEGRAHRLSSDDLFIGEAGAGPQRFQVPGDRTHVMFGCELRGSTGSFGARLVAPDGSATECSLNNPGTSPQRRVQVAVLPATQGQWGLVFTQTGQGSVFVEVAGVRAEA